MRWSDQHPLRQRLLGAHVAERAQQIAGHGQPGVILQPRQPEIRDPEVALHVQQEIGRLDVAVHDAELVCVIQSLGRLDSQRGGPIGKYSRLREDELGIAGGARSVGVEPPCASARRSPGPGSALR